MTGVPKYGEFLTPFYYYIILAANLMPLLYKALRARTHKHVISWSDDMLEAFADTEASLAGAGIQATLYLCLS